MREGAGGLLKNLCFIRKGAALRCGLIKNLGLEGREFIKRESLEKKGPNK